MKKIPSLFVRDWDGNPDLVTPNLDPKCQWVADGEGVPTLKRDGTCVRILDQGDRVWKRYDCKHGKTPPPDFVPADDKDEKTGHWPGWVPADLSKPENQYLAEAMKVQDHWQDGTYELCGPKVGVNPDRLASHILIQHGSEVVHGVPRTFEELKTWFSAHEIEGIVWHHKDGRMAKIKRADFGYPWGAKKEHSRAIPL